LGAEVRNPSKNIPKGIITGLLIIIILYLTINYAYYKVIGFNELKTSSNIAAIMASHIFGNGAGNILSILLFLGVLAYVNVQLMVGPRIMEAMSQDAVIPKIFENRTAKKNVLAVGLSLFASLIIVTIFWAKTFEEILSFSIFLDCFGMVLASATIFKFRKNTSHLNGTGIFQMKLFPLLPIIFMLTYTFVAIVIFIDKPFTGMLGVGILAAFVGLYFIIQFLKKYFK
jgi:basic amino acid/polyamine antiporter, APA family